MSRQLLLCLALLGAACGRVEGVPADAGPPDAEPFVCETQADCEVLSGCGEWNECSGFDGCREDGEQQRVCNQYDCGPAGVCVVTESHVEKQPCSRDRTGDECGAKTCGEYTACDAPGDTCARAGTRSRSCDVDVCQGGECVATVREEVASCERATDALPCGEDCVATGECVYAGECNESGSQPGTCTARICVAGACVTSGITRDMPFACARATTGNTCNGGATSCAQSCPFPNGTPDERCVEDVTGSETCTPYRCVASGCVLDATGNQVTSIPCHRTTVPNKRCETIGCGSNMIGSGRHRCCVASGDCADSTFCEIDCEPRGF